MAQSRALRGIADEVAVYESRDQRRKPFVAARNSGGSWSIS